MAPANAVPAHAPAEAFFLPVQDGLRYCLFHVPQGACRGALVYLHPFAEEMNKSRRMAALQARALAARGVGVLQIDLHGCGDSSGEFGDARWDGWKRDVDAARAWLEQRLGRRAGLWGLRLGALLALDYAAGAAATPPCLLLWQPVTSGAGFLTQFLRLRVAAELLQDGAGNGGTKALRLQLEQGRSLEIAGYELAPPMAAAIERLDASVLAPRGCRIDWFEVTAAPERPLPPAASRIAAIWQAQGIDFGVQLVHGEPFWTTPEISECAALLDATAALYREASDAS
ncbi:esterase [Massilia sp. WF1]|uniref:hydrolase 2, exosortase A system-associated n=1 Tax=unclassified Massilia TaxID=2609279 RepID=UPI00068A2914|nr:MULTISPECIES: hydrolase 2, exosortase A system-associated [unclassified Massilia]ALK95193.1 esterase [Massilia sp. WG5]KNZ67478.1 esterase [Massilia sp. WF1]